MREKKEKKPYVKVGYKATELRKVVFNWDDWVKEEESIVDMIQQGCSLQFMGNKYGVSRQRMLQVIQKFKKSN